MYGFDDLTPVQRHALEVLSDAAGADVVVSLTWEPRRIALAARGDAVEALRPRAAAVVELPALADYYEPQSRAALHHLERHLFGPAPAERLDPGAAVRLMESGGERAEAELVAAEVLALLRAGVPACEIAVVYRSLRRAGALLERVFGAFGIPVAMRREVPFAHAPLGRGVLALARCALLGERRASATELIAYLRTPGLLAEPGIADRVEAAVRRSGLRSAAEALAQSDLRLSELELLRRARDPLHELGRQARRLFSSRRRGLAPVLGVREEFDGLALAVLLRALEDLRELRERLTGEELVEMLERLTVPVEATRSRAAVLVAEPLEIRATRFRMVFVCGLQESDFPRAGAPDPLLGDELRRELAALPAADGNGGGLRLRPRENTLEHERYLFYAAVTRATEQVLLSYRSSDEEGGIELPSPFIADVAELFDEGWTARRRRRLLADVVWSAGDAPTARELARSVAVAEPQRAVEADGQGGYVLGQAALSHVRHRTLVSAGALENYADCPVKWLVERELQPQPFAPDADSIVRGQVVHRVLEELYRRIGGPVNEATLAQAEATAGKLLLEHAAAVGAGRPPAIRAGLVSAIEADVRRFLAQEVSCGGEWPADNLELRFGFDEEPETLPALELPDGVRVRGVIDRVDVEPGSDEAGRQPAGEGSAATSATVNGDRQRRAIVRDYKTGGTRPEFQGARWEATRRLQVPLYMLAVRQLLSLDPVAGFYQPLGGDDLRPRGVFVEGAPVGSEVVRTDARAAQDVEAALAAAAQLATTLAAGLRAGRLRPCPETCSRGGCAYPGICRAG